MTKVQSTGVLIIILALNPALGYYINIGRETLKTPDSENNMKNLTAQQIEDLATEKMMKRLKTQSKGRRLTKSFLG